MGFVRISLPATESCAIVGGRNRAQWGMMGAVKGGDSCGYNVKDSAGVWYGRPCNVPVYGGPHHPGAENLYPKKEEVTAVHILSLGGIIGLILCIGIFALIIYLVILVIKALRKYIKSEPARKEVRAVRMSLSEKLRENRTRCKMSQEFVAEAVGVTRQAVSKWETGQSDPSTANLIALSKLYGISAEELLKGL